MTPIILVILSTSAPHAPLLAELHRMAPAIAFVTEANSHTDRTLYILDDHPEEWGAPDHIGGEAVQNERGHRLALVYRCQDMGPVHCARVAIHEVGHLLGVSHSTDRADIMYPKYAGQSRCAFCSLVGTAPMGPIQGAAHSNGGKLYDLLQVRPTRGAIPARHHNRQRQRNYRDVWPAKVHHRPLQHKRARAHEKYAHVGVTRDARGRDQNLHFERVAVQRH